MEILVKADTRELELHIRQQFPAAEVTITSVGANSLMLKGTAASVEDATGIVELAEQFAPKVLNRIKVGAAIGSRTRKSSDRSLTTSATEPRAVRQANGTKDDANSKSTGEVISYRDLARWGSPLKELDGAVNLLLLKQAAKNAKLDIGSKEIDAEVLQQASKFKLSVDQWYSMLEKERGISRDHYRDLVTFPMQVLKRLAGDDTKQQLTFLSGLRTAAQIELVDPDAKLPPLSAEATEPAPIGKSPDVEVPTDPY